MSALALPPTIRAATAQDLDAVLALNEAAVPEVGHTDPAQLAWFLANAYVFWVVEAAGSGALDAFLIALTEGSTYGSPNYRWFAERYERFVYVDRIAVSPQRQGGGVGRALYRRLVDVAVGEAAPARPVLTAEVNIRPRNDRSLAFHERFGFRPVGEQEDPRHDTRVALLACPLARPS